MDYETIAETTAFLQATLGPLPDVAVILGSGLGDFAEGLADATSWPSLRARSRDASRAQTRTFMPKALP